MDLAWLAAIGVLLLVAGLCSLAYDTMRKRQGNNPYPFPDAATAALDETASRPRANPTGPSPQQDPHPLPKGPARNVSLRLRLWPARASARRAAPMIVLGLLLVAWTVGTAFVASSLSAPERGAIVVGIAQFQGTGTQSALSDALASDILQGAAGDNIPNLVVRISQARPATWEQAEAERAAMRADFLWWGEIDGAGNITTSLALDPGFAPVQQRWQQFEDPDLYALMLPLRAQLRLTAGQGTGPLTPLSLALAHFRAGQFALALKTATGAQATVDQGGGSGQLARLVGAVALIAMRDGSQAAAQIAAIEKSEDLPPEALDDRALARLQVGDYNSAESDAGRVIAERDTTNRTLAVAYLVRGRARLASQNYEGAVGDFDESLRLDPTHLPTGLARADALYRESQPDAARAQLEALAAAAPDAAPAHRLMGLVWLMLAQPQRAQSSLAASEKIYQGWISGLRASEGQAQVTGDAAQQQAATDGIVQLNRELAAVYLYEGMAYADQARQEPAESFIGGIWRRVRGQPTTYELALGRMQQAARLDPRRADIPLQMSSVYTQMGDTTSAAASLDQARALDPAAPEPYMSLAKLQGAQKDTQSAAATLSALISQLPSYYEAYQSLYDLYTSAGDAQSARATLERALLVPTQSPADHLWHGKFLRLLGRDSEAVAELRIAAADPNLWEAHLQLGQMLLQSGRNADALAQFQQVLATQPNQPEALLGAGRLLVLSGQPDQAAELFKRLTTLSPDNVDGHVAYLQLLLSKGNINQAIAEGQKAVQGADGRADTHFFLGEAFEAGQDWPRAAQQFSIATQRDPTLFEAFIRLARALFKDDRYVESLQASQTARQMRPGDPQSYRWEAEAHLALGDSSGAGDSIRSALDLAPGDADLLALASRVYAAQGVATMAIDYANKATAADPQNPAGALALGDLYLARGQTSDATQAYDAALAAAPASAPALVGQGRTQDALGEAGKALALYGQAVKADPSYAEARLYSGHVYVELGRWDDALAEYKAAAQIRPRWPLALYYLGRAYLQGKDLQSAANAFSGATQYGPNLVEGWFGLGITDRERGQPAGALAALTRATQLNPGYAQAWLYLGLTYEEAGDRPNAASAFAQARDTATTDDIRQQAREGLLRVK